MALVDSYQLILAAMDGDARKVLDLLLTGAVVDTVDSKGRTASFYASGKSHLDVLRVLNGFGADLNHADRDGATPLHAACQWSGDERVMKYLVDNGAVPSLRDSAGNSILHSAAALGNREGIEFSIRRGIDVHSRNCRGQTPLIVAAFGCRDPGVLGLLVDRGAEIGAKDESGATLLHTAAENCNDVVVEFALGRGMKVDERTFSPESFTALDCVGEGESAERVRGLLVDAYRTQLPRCRFCDKEPAHIQMKPCRHRTSCVRCSGSWLRCHCGRPIQTKVNTITCRPGEAERPAEDERLEAVCAVCLDRPVAVVFADCGHRSCEECSILLVESHFCRRPMGKRIKFF